MNPAAQEHLDHYISSQRGAAPEGWVRLVVWICFLADGSGRVHRSSWTSPQTAVVLDAGSGSAAVQGVSVSGDAQGALHLLKLEAALAGEAEEGYSVLRIEVDRDGAVRADFSHEPARPFEGSISDPFFDDVHEYAERHRDELEALVGRLRAHGDLDV